jgi:IS5 family transposase
MRRLTPWSELVAAIAGRYPRGEGHVRPPIGLERMLRTYIAQNCFRLSGEGIVGAIYDSQAIRCCLGIDLGHEPAPDATTPLKFCRLLDDKQLAETMFKTILAHPAATGLSLSRDMGVGATIIAAPSSTSNAKGALALEMHQIRKGSEWHFGMKAHIGVDAESGLLPTVICTTANVADVTQAKGLLHGGLEHAFGAAHLFL